MTSLFALAGPAEAAAAAEQGLLCLSLFVGCFLAFVALLKRSQIAAAFGTFLVYFSTLLFSPWIGFRPEPTTDPDVIHIQKMDRVLAWMWVVGVIVTLGGIVRAVSKYDTPPSDHQPQKIDESGS